MDSTRLIRFLQARIALLKAEKARLQAAAGIGVKKTGEKWTFELLRDGFKAFGDDKESREAGLEALKDAYLQFRQNHEALAEEEFQAARELTQQSQTEEDEGTMREVGMENLRSSVAALVGRIDAGKVQVLTKPAWFKMGHGDQPWIAEIWLFDEEPPQDDEYWKIDEDMSPDEVQIQEPRKNVEVPTPDVVDKKFLRKRNQLVMNIRKKSLKKKLNLRMLIVHVHVMVADTDDPREDPNTPWKVTGINLRHGAAIELGDTLLPRKEVREARGRGRGKKLMGIIIPDSEQECPWDWKEGKEPWTHNVLIKGDEGTYQLASGERDKKPLRVEELNEDAEYFVIPRQKKKKVQAQRKQGHQLRLDRTVEPWASNFADVQSAQSLLKKCFIDDDGNFRSTRESAGGLSGKIAEHLGRKSVTIEVEAT
eukprot:g2084.t1